MGFRIFIPEGSRQGTCTHRHRNTCQDVGEKQYSRYVSLCAFTFGLSLCKMSMFGGSSWKRYCWKTFAYAWSPWAGGLPYAYRAGQDHTKWDSASSLELIFFSMFGRVLILWGKYGYRLSKTSSTYSGSTGIIGSKFQNGRTFSREKQYH